ncbi:MAG TPA: Flp pilus assembly protein CpaB, partial [bacterium]|nr:Flp pilus assembly protein CpaB [bacterium]
LYPGEVLMNHRLTPQGGSGGLPTLIPEGYRAITLRVDDTISVAGFVHPGDHVDVLTTVDLPDMDGESATKAILQNVKVIATGQEIERSDENKPKTVSTVTVLTTLEQAERLTLATIAGTIRLVLRNHADHQQSYTPGITLSGLIPQSRRESSQPEPSTGIAVPPPRPVRTVQVYRGGEKSEVTFPR